MIGTGGMYRHLIAEGCPPDLAVVAIGDPEARSDEAWANGGPWDKFVSAKASVYTLKVGVGCMIMAGAVVHGEIGEHVVIGNNAVTSHDCVVGDYVTIGPGAVLCGGVSVGEGAFIGAGAVVTPGVVVPPWTLVKAGTVWKTK